MGYGNFDANVSGEIPLGGGDILSNFYRS